uniref:hypothetical protein n=1 Tax=Desulfurobacterium sp. TaxID=2004706 RepID=UPI00261AFDD7
GLNYGKVKREPLRGTNLFYFNSSIPVVIVLPKDKEVVNAFVYSAGGGSVIYRKNLIIVSPPEKGSGKFMTVIAVDKDGNEYTFIGEAVNPLYESVPVYGKYVYYESQKMTPSEVLLFYKQLTGHCPNNGDTISISGQKYLFKVVDKIYTRDEVSACGKNYKVIPE